MSTYNGERYLEEQLDSILAQTYSRIKILIRDDGSSDATIDILKRYEEKYENISYYAGKNIGVIQSFFDLLRNSDEHVTYYGFSDQDDVWLSDKVERAVEILEGKKTERPLLYCSDTYITDERLNIIKKDNKSPRPSWGNALVQNICTGCTAVINKSLRDIVKDTRPTNIVMHDWWLYITAELFGEVCYDDEAHIKYRQHGDNAYGSRKSEWDVWKYRFEQLVRGKRGYLYQQLMEVQKWYGNIEGKKSEQLRLVYSTQHGLDNRIKLIMDQSVYRNKKMDDLIYRGIVVLGKL